MKSFSSRLPSISCSTSRRDWPRSRARSGTESRPRAPLRRRSASGILDAAERLIAERGCAGTSIEAIVKAAGVSSVTFYELFEGKEECFVAAFDRAVEETVDELARGGGRAGGALLARAGRDRPAGADWR